MKFPDPVLLVLHTQGGDVPSLVTSGLEGTLVEAVTAFSSLPKGRRYRTALIVRSSAAISGETCERLRAWVDSVVRAHLAPGASAVWL